MFARPSAHIAAISAVCALLVVPSSGCSDGYDWKRPNYERGTLGEELFAIWRKDAARAPNKADARVRMLDRHRSGFVGAVDRLAPPDQLEALDQFLRTANRSVDSGLVPSLTRKLELEFDRAANDPELLAALADDSNPVSEAYLAQRARPNLPAYAFQYNEIRPAVETLGGALLSADGVDAKGRPAQKESTAFADAQRALSRELADSDSGDGSPAVTLRDLLLIEDRRFRSDRDVELGAVRFDRRGFPLVTDASPKRAAFEPVAPFVDQNGDGLADVEGRSFVLQGHDNRRVAPFATSKVAPLDRSSDGRAQSGGTPAFEYIDLSRTGLHWTVRRVARLHRDDVVWKLLDGLPALLGDRVRHKSDQGAYRGYAADQPLLDVLHSGLELFNFEKLAPALRGLADFLDGQSAELARLLDAFDRAKSAIDAVPDARLTDDSTIGYDLLPIVEQTAANPELWSDLMAGLRKPVVAKTGVAMATMLRYKTRDTLPAKNGSYNGCFQQCKTKWEGRATPEHPHGIGKVGRFECIRDCAVDANCGQGDRNCPSGEIFTKETDFDAPESPNNRSIHQQLFHLLRDTAGAPYKMTIERAKLGPLDLTGLPPIVTLSGSAEAFVRTIAGNLKIKNHISQKLRNDPLLGNLLDVLNLSNGDVADLLSTLSGLFGAHLDEEPTPDQITRLFNQPDLKFQVAGFEIDVRDPTCHDGYVVANHHADKLFASEASGLIDAVQPVAKAYSDHGREDLFTRLFEVIHAHYSTHDDLYKQKDGSLSPMKGANLVSYEPALLEIAKSGYLFRALRKFAVAVDEVELESGDPFEERLRTLVYNAVRTDRPLEGPNGSSTLKLPDGTKVDDPSRLHFLLHSVGELVDRIEGSPKKKEKLEDVLKTFADVFVDTKKGSNGNPVFEQPGTVALLSLGAREFADSAETWRQAGTLDAKLSQDGPQALEEAVTSRMLPETVDLLRELGATPERRKEVDGLVHHLLARGPGRDQVTAAGYRHLASTAGVDSKPALRRTLSRVLDPDRTWGVETRSKLPFVSHALTIVHRLNRRDEPGTGIDLARRALRRGPQGDTALGTIADVISDYYRAEPASKRPYQPEDYRRVFTELSSWFGDDEHGLEQLYDLIGRRAAAP